MPLYMFITNLMAMYIQHTAVKSTPIRPDMVQGKVLINGALCGVQSVCPAVCPPDIERAIGQGVLSA